MCAYGLRRRYGLEEGYLKRLFFEILKNVKLTRDVYELTLLGNTEDITAPGQFVNIELEGFFLRRPISVCDWTTNRLTLVYKTVGEGTKKLSKMESGKLDILSGLGNGFNLNACGENPLLIGGGVGTPPIFGLCKKLVEIGTEPTVVLGFNNVEEVFYQDEFKKLGAKVLISTVDGTLGVNGFVTDAIRTLKAPYSSYCACGPEPMLRALSKELNNIKGQLSFEEHMACGFGACMGCSCKTKYGSKRICKDGPVLSSDEVIW